MFERNKDAIAFFQAGCVGCWAEFHDSANKLDMQTNPVAGSAVIRVRANRSPSH